MIEITEIQINSQIAQIFIKNKYGPLYDGQKIDYEKVMKFSKLMREGKWEKLQNQESPISISANGKLMNGLHRLLAICDSGVTIADFVAQNVPELIYGSGDKTQGKEFDVFIFACAEFVLDYMDIQTRSHSTVEKIYDYIKDDIAKFSIQKQNWNRFDCAIAIACVYSFRIGAKEEHIKNILQNFSTKKTTPNEYFDRYCVQFLDYGKDLFIAFLEDYMLPKTIFESVPV